MHVGNNSSSEARHHVTQQEQHSRVENKPPQSPREMGTLEGAGHQPPRDISCTSSPRFTAQGAVCHPVTGAADPRSGGLMYKTMPRWVLCIRYGHTGPRNEGIPSATCAFTGLSPSVISSRDSTTRSSQRSGNLTVPMTHQKNYQNTALSQFSLQIQKKKNKPTLIPPYFNQTISRRGQNANTCMVSAFTSSLQQHLHACLLGSEKSSDFYSPTSCVCMSSRSSGEPGTSHTTFPSSTWEHPRTNAGGDLKVIAKKGTNRSILYQKEEIMAISRGSLKMKHLCLFKETPD